MQYKEDELTEAKRQITSILHKLYETVKSLESKADTNRYKSQITLAIRRIDAFEIALSLIEREMLKCENTGAADETANESDKQALLSNLEKLHTTDLGLQRIKKNLSLDTDDMISWCKGKIQKPDALITRKGKNWYVNIDGCVITINAHSCTVITAHRKNL